MLGEIEAGQISDEMALIGFDEDRLRMAGEGVSGAGNDFGLDAAHIQFDVIGGWHIEV